MTKLAFPRAADAPPIPETVDAEQALLGALLYDESAMGRVQALRPDQFFEPLHARLFEATRDMISEKGRADAIVLGERFAKDPSFIEFGGVKYLADLIDRAPPAVNAGQYAELIIDAWTQRRLLTIAQDTQAAVMERANPSTVISQLREDLERLETEAAPDDDGLVAAHDATEEVIAQLEEEQAHGKPRGFLTGLRCVDYRLGGLKPGWLVTIGARPSMGKTALLRAILYGAAERTPSAQFAFFAIEMERREIIERAMSAAGYQAGEFISYRDIGNGKVAPSDLLRLKQLARAKAPRNLLIDDRSILSLEDVRRKVWAMKRKGPVAAIGIDYLQLMEMPRRDGRNDAALWGDITRGLKRLAREAGICVILLSQLSRAVESRDDKRPQLADLRESGSIEQDSNAVLFPYREFYYLSRNEPKGGGPEHEEWEMRCEELRNRLDVIAAKVRQGAVGTDRQVYVAECDHVEDEREARP